MSPGCENLANFLPSTKFPANLLVRLATSLVRSLSFANLMPHKRNDGGDQITVQAAQGAFAVCFFYDQDNAGIGCSLGDDCDAFAGQRRNGAGGTHRVNGEACASAGAGGQATSAPDTPA